MTSEDSPSSVTQLEDRAIVVDPADNVATAIVPLAAGLTLAVANSALTLAEAIPAGFKFALTRIPKGQAVTKYGEMMARATVDIAAGEMVHVHNAESCRGRGDRRT